LKFKIYLFSLVQRHDDSYGPRRGISACRSIRSTVIVGQLVTAKRL